MKIYGYVRVSSADQNIDRQMIALIENGLCEKDIFIDKQSGKDFNRPQYKRMLKVIKPGDLIYIKSIDRLGRNYEDILEQWSVITRTMKVDICVIDFPLLDTRINENGLTGQFIADLVLQILSYVAQIERENIHQRQSEGIIAAKNRGVKFGRPKKSIPNEFYYYKSLWEKGEISKREAGRRLNVNHMTFSKWIDESKKENKG